ncbi:TolB-like translocation protein [Streptomyces actinomycinicus]|uniref:TolB-like translocation protein n=1 Tax=Streptomyces actinomycinicus TaxID=1695166 RepID=A0A937ESV5_9ACTN|nr:TolB-like translocation protein [Streptomyces actinomycinicus]MBL1087556.1 TolB-like translocation protein [Streptomyces actinomycinicus]
MIRKCRLPVLIVCILLLAAVAGYSVRRAAERTSRLDRPAQGGPAVLPGPVTLAGDAGRRVVFRNMVWGPHRDELASVPADKPTGPRVASGVKCLRFSAAAGTGICLQGEHGVVRDTYRAVVLDQELRERRTFPLAGTPTRARVSPSGRTVAWTVFVSGDSYTGTGFSTRTSLLDTEGWVLRDNLETYTVIKEGRPYKAADVNVWGVTFADDRTFYVTVATGGQTYLAAGDVASRELTLIHGNAECPSLSPTGDRVAYKKRVPGLPADAPWRLYVLDLRTMKETPTAEQRNVDDQAVWTGDGSLVYSLAGDQGTDLWTVRADGKGAPRRLLEGALAPAVLGR